MSDDKFAWRTEEDGWEDLPPEAETAVTPASRFRWLLGFALLILLGLGGIFSYWQLHKQVTAVATTTRDDVIAVHRLLMEAEQTQDAELFASLLSPTDTFWYSTQQAMLDLGLVLDRAPMSLWADPTGTAADVQVTLSPDLTHAEVTDLYPFIVETTPGITQTITLSRTAVYTRDGNRWLLAPFPTDTAYWGKWITVYDAHLRLTFTERDAALGYRLAPQLDELVRQLCQNTAVSCPSNFRLQLRLSHDTAILLQLREIYSSFSLPIQMDLPTPTLVGRPVDDASYEALWRGYASLVTAVIINRRDSYTDYDAVASMTEWGISLPPPLGYKPQTAVSTPPIPLPDQDVQLLCAAPSNQSTRYKLWRYDLAEDTWTDVPPPAENTTVSQMLPWFDDTGVLLSMSQMVSGQERYRTIYWQQDTMHILIDSVHPYTVLAGLNEAVASVGHHYLPIYEYGQEEDAVGRIRIFDLQDCTANGCAAVDVTGMTYWSPDGRFSLIMHSGQWPSRLLLGDDRAQKLTDVGEGWSPVWLDADTFAYVRLAQPVSAPNVMQQPVELVVVDVLTSTQTLSEAKVLWTSQDLQAFLDIHADAVYSSATDTIFVNGVYRYSPRPGELIISAIAVNEFGSTHQFYLHYDTYDTVMRPLTLLFALNDVSGSSLLFTEDGRFLSVLSANANSLTLYVYNTETDMMTSYVTSAFYYPGLVYDWSADNQWLVISEDRLLRFIAPAYHYELPVFHNLPDCQTAVWVNK